MVKSCPDASNSPGQPGGAGLPAQGSLRERPKEGTRPYLEYLH